MNDIYTVSEVANRAGLADNTIRYLADTGRLPVLKSTKGTRIFLKRDVDIFLAERAAKAEKKKK